jgi:hypothetical protein
MARGIRGRSRALGALALALCLLISGTAALAASGGVQSATTQTDRPDPCVGPIEEEPTGSTVVTT